MKRNNPEAKAASLTTSINSSIVRASLAPTPCVHHSAVPSLTLWYHYCVPTKALPDGQIFLRIAVKAKTANGEVRLLNGDDFYQQLEEHRDVYDTRIDKELAFLMDHLIKEGVPEENAKRVLKGKDVLTGDEIKWDAKTKNPKMDFNTLKSRDCPWLCLPEKRNPFHCREGISIDEILATRRNIVFDVANILLNQRCRPTANDLGGVMLLEKMVAQLQANGFVVDLYCDLSGLKEIKTLNATAAMRLERLGSRVKLAGGTWFLGEPRSSVDRALLEHAERVDGLIISRDRYTDYPRHHERFLEAGDCPRLALWAGDSTSLSIPVLGLEVSL